MLAELKLLVPAPGTLPAAAKRVGNILGTTKSVAKMNIHIKRVYEVSSPDDGMRILIDRLWPRGMTREKAHIDLWLKEVAPSTELRKWFNHDPEKWLEFKRRYLKELRRQPEAMKHLVEVIGTRRATLLFGAKEERFNDAVALREFIQANGK
ncbi:MAG: DUF488 domain-containing protein [Gallionella sp.]